MNVLKELYHGNIKSYAKHGERSLENVNFFKIMTGKDDKSSEFLTALFNDINEQHLLSQMVSAQSE